MSKRLILVLALVFAVGVVAAHAETQNVKVSGDITVQAVTRHSLGLKDNEDHANYAGNENAQVENSFGEDVAAILSQVRVRVDADLTDNVSTTVRLINERTWGEEDADQDDLEDDSTRVAIDLAYVTLKEFLYSPLTLTIGRQELRFGNGLIIGDVDTNNRAAGHNGALIGAGLKRNVLPESIDDLSLRKSFDAIRATLNYDPVIADLIYAKIDENNVSIRDDVDLYGINVGYTYDKDTFLEGYFWQRQRESDMSGLNVNNNNATGGNDDPLGNSNTEVLNTVGLRGVYTGLERLVLQLEGAFQFGDHVVNNSVYPNDAGAIANMGILEESMLSVRAWALQALFDYALPVYEKYSPMIGFQFTYLSGNNYTSIDDHYYGWDPMFEDQLGGTLINKIFGATNCQLYTLTGSLKPIEDVTLKIAAHYLRLNQPVTDIAYQANPAWRVWLTNYPGDPTYSLDGGNKEAGSEVDVTVVYDYTEDVQFSLSGGAFMPGDAFTTDQRLNNDKTATQVIGSMKVTF